MLKYFAYGSNMYSPRLRCRVPGCAPLGIAMLPGHELRFHKRSKDGSAKGDAFNTGVREDQVVGVLYDIPEDEKAALNDAEGLGKGYREDIVGVILADGSEVFAHSYFATADYILPALQPYEWYKEFVVSGASEHHLPADYVAQFIDAVMAIPDPKPERDHEERQKLRFW